MLKKRITAILPIKSGILVQSIAFNKYLPVGKPEIAVEFLNEWGIDEIIILDITATLEGRTPDYDMIKRISKKCFVPLTSGGGIKTIEEMRLLTHFGADKIAINSSALKNPGIIEKAAKVFGSQCVVVSIDARPVSTDSYEVYSNSGTIATEKTPAEWARQAENLGAGEILINSISHDGQKKGYDINLIKAVSNTVSIPVIALGGAGNPRHFLECAKETTASSLAAGNFFHFTEHSPITLKAYLKQNNICVRLDTYADYNELNFEEDTGRLKKLNETYFQKLRFEYHTEEII
ncbi:imidazole glycerol phosphate synthase subunit HisF [Candidatus Omnitrophus magneticus]|uniref:imidazole glycerol-phosphate synthase n=1 Tax=Candidatus Omnitrophus magneticus TaxID=1609969 RepID=A0A0F0CV00_9BACT|nr:imidazole glycerol phosphate synthase subunit HisF [Candidatus Omnitrophus magneticus]